MAEVTLWLLLAHPPLSHTFAHLLLLPCRDPGRHKATLPDTTCLQGLHYVFSRAGVFPEVSARSAGNGLAELKTTLFYLYIYMFKEDRITSPILLPGSVSTSKY